MKPIPLGSHIQVIRRVLSWGWPISIIFICAISQIWPADAPWLNDEPLLISMAIDNNVAGRMGQHGLMGSRGAYYGPLPIWIYQVILLFSHNVVVVGKIHALLIAVPTALGLIEMLKRFRLPRAFILIVLLSPYLWMYCRVIGDNNLCIPLGILAFAAYASVERNHNAWSARLIAFILPAMLLVHLMSIVVVVPIFICLYWWHRSLIWKSRWSVFGILCVFVLLSKNYWFSLTQSDVFISPDTTTRWTWMSAMTGGRIMSAAGMGFFLGSGWHRLDTGVWGYVIRAAHAVSSVAIPLSWFGFVLCARRTLEIICRRQQVDVMDQMVVLAFLVFVLHFWLTVSMGVPGQPQYLAAAWGAYIVFVWLAVAWLSRRGLMIQKCVFGAHLTSLVIVLAYLMCSIHTNGGYRQTVNKNSWDEYGPALGSQLEAVVQMRGFSSRSQIQSSIPNIKMFPHVIEVLRRLDGATENGPIATFMLDYCHPDGKDCRMKVRQCLPSGAAREYTASRRSHDYWVSQK